MEAGSREVKLSRISRALVRLLAPPDEADEILGDLTEESAAIAQSAGATAARRWQRWQIAHSIIPWLLRRTGDTRRQLFIAITTTLRSIGDVMGLLTDVRVSTRRLLKTPAFTALAVATLAIGIGAVSTVFGLAHALWLKPLPYAAPERLVWIQAEHQASKAPASLTASEFDQYSQSQTLAGAAGFSYGAGIARVNGEPLRIVAYRVSTNLFRVLGVRPALGRDFTNDDAVPGAMVLMLSHATWQKRFGGDPDITSKTMTLFDVPYRIAGVMPEGFAFPRGLESEVWLPQDVAASATGNARQWQTVARLADGRSIADASAEIGARAARLAATSSTANDSWTARVVGAGATTDANSRLAYQSLLGLVALFLLISCANLAGLLISRNAARRAEIAVCLSIGAPRWRLARTLLVETLLIATAGCAAGITLANYGARLVVSFMPAKTPGIDGVHINSLVIVVAVTLSVAAAILIALAPALGLRTMKPMEALAGARTTSQSSSRAQRVLVIAEVALAVLLVIGAGVMVRSLTSLVGRDRGYNPSGLYALNVSLPFSTDTYRQTERRARAFDDIVARVAAVPGVRAAAATTGFPGSSLGILGAAPVTPVAGAATVMAGVHAASGDYFAAMGIPIKAGRTFQPADSTQAPGVVIVNEELAKSFPGGNPIGQRIPISILGADATPFEVVGIAGNIRLGDRVGPRLFVPLSQTAPYWIDLVFRADGGDTTMQAVRAALRATSADLLLENESSFRTIINNSLALERTESAFAVMIGVLATIVTGIGLYSLMTFVMTQRRRELGIRLALGSAPSRLFRDAMTSALRLVAVGLLLGVGATALLVRALGTRVFGLTSADAGAYITASLFVLAVSVAAVWLPARRMMQTDPLIALRIE